MLFTAGKIQQEGSVNLWRALVWSCSVSLSMSYSKYIPYSHNHMYIQLRCTTQFSTTSQYHVPLQMYVVTCHLEAMAVLCSVHMQVGKQSKEFLSRLLAVDSDLQQIINLQGSCYNHSTRLQGSCPFLLQVIDCLQIIDQLVLYCANLCNAVTRLVIFLLPFGLGLVPWFLFLPLFIRVGILIR